MCGIVGFIGNGDVKEILYKGLEKLEYRGYDSAGISVLSDVGEITTKKATGRLINLSEHLDDIKGNSILGIGHTRWATHGKPSVRNSHPHMSNDLEISVVHNGIIENYLELKEGLLSEGFIFNSDTDTEVIVHLISKHYNGDLFDTVRRVLPLLEGAYSLGVISLNERDRIIAARKGSPLVIGLGTDMNILASDIPALLDKTSDVIFLEDGELALIKRDSVSLFDVEGNSKKLNVTKVDWDIESSQKGGYDHFMLKEIFEQPKAISDTLAAGTDIHLSDEEVRNINKIHIVACGTSWHAGLVGKSIIEGILRIPVEVEVASEFRYKDPIISKNDLVILISQSGETADTLAALREAKGKGGKTLGIINVLGSSISREADGTFYTNAGLEIGVASTKAYVAQLIALYKLVLFIGEKKGISSDKIDEVRDGLPTLSDITSKILSMTDELKEMAKEFKDVRSTMFIGRGVNTATALEGALKLKEISYIHAEGYPSGELKHGPIALIEDSCPTVAIASSSYTLDKVKSNIEEVRARGGRVYSFASEGDVDIDKISSKTIFLPLVPEVFSPLTNVVALQLLSYYVTVDRGLDVDKPRNLAKSVTVE